MLQSQNPALRAICAPGPRVFFEPAQSHLPGPYSASPAMYGMTNSRGSTFSWGIDSPMSPQPMSPATPHYMGPSSWGQMPAFPPSTPHYLGAQQPPTINRPGLLQPAPAFNQASSPMGPPRRPSQDIADREYDFLVDGTPRAGSRTSTVSNELVARVDAMVEKWRKKATAHWARPSLAEKCVQARARSFRSRHEDPNYPKTACDKCVSRKEPCVIAYPNCKPVILPLPVPLRPAGATFRDMAYYIKE